MSPATVAPAPTPTPTPYPYSYAKLQHIQHAQHSHSHAPAPAPSNRCKQALVTMYAVDMPFMLDITSTITSIIKGEYGENGDTAATNTIIDVITQLFMRIASSKSAFKHALRAVQIEITAELSKHLIFVIHRECASTYINPNPHIHDRTEHILRAVDACTRLIYATSQPNTNISWRWFRLAPH